MYGILDKYIGKNIIMAVILVAVCLTLFAGLINFIDSLRYIGRGQVDFWFLLAYNCYKLPGILVTFFPVSILIGGVVGLGLMARNSEIVIIQSIGLSKLNIGLSCVKSILPLIIAVLLIGELVVPRLDRVAEESYELRSSSLGVSLTTSGVWIKEGDSFIGICGVIGNSLLAGVVRYEFEGTKLKSFKKAKSGRYHDGKWIMTDVYEQNITDSEIRYSVHNEEIWPLNINLKRIEVLSDMSENLSLFQLHDYIRYIEHNGVDSSRYRLSFYNKLFLPVVMLVMMLLALSTVFGPLRSINMGARILSGITLGFSYYVLNQIVAPLTLVYGVPPIIGSTFATVVFALFSLYLLKRKS
ncbi:MAG: LPS export ABC transporter permease LptG [Succinivibrio sp.]